MMKLGCALLLACAMTHAPAVRGETIWKLTTGTPAGVFHARNLTQFAEEVAAATSGRLRLEVHSDVTLASLPQIALDVRSGSIDAGEFIMTNMAAELPTMGMDSVPFLVRSYADARRLWLHQRRVLEPVLAKRNLIILYACPWPPQGIFSSKPLRSPADLRGVRMRTTNALTVNIARQLGATPVEVARTDVGAAFADGRIDSMFTSVISGVDIKVWAHAKYFYDVKAWIPKNIVVVNKERFDALNEPLRVLLLKVASEAEARGWAMSEAETEKAVAELGTHGGRIEVPDYLMRQELNRLGERFAREWLPKSGPEASAILLPFYINAK